jgi:hypothetical protein
MRGTALLAALVALLYARFPLAGYIGHLLRRGVQEHAERVHECLLFD